ncbi:hypothetical protein Glove_464g52 [Diversispora epigaea]|uniref:Uncharacterized protein n=1 Tax=Diversispora epigaea TaxID=1348612 RepID=A0A397GSY0_9GLOM|nr:hypothetical protein Glove_464g52 [Diversispora epigaea]
MINCERIEQLNRTIAEIIKIYNQKIEEIINFAEEQRNNKAPAIVDFRKIQELRHIRAQINCLIRIKDSCQGNLSPKGSTFTQTKPSTRSNTPTSSDSPNQSVSSTFTQTKPSTRSNTPTSSDSPNQSVNFKIEYQPITSPPRNKNTKIEPEDQLLIDFNGSDNNNNLEPKREKPNEEDQDIEVYNNENLRQFL